MLQLIIVSVIVSIFTFICVFFCGAYCHAVKKEGDGLSKSDAVWLFFVTAICIFMSALCWVVTGKARVKTRELPTIERKVTQREQEGEIKSDTLYIFKFR